MKRAKADHDGPEQPVGSINPVNPINPVHPPPRSHSISAAAAGILSRRISPLGPALRGRLKARVSDFCVREIAQTKSENRIRIARLPACYDANLILGGQFEDHPALTLPAEESLFDEAAKAANEANAPISRADLLNVVRDALISSSSSASVEESTGGDLVQMDKDDATLLDEFLSTWEIHQLSQVGTSDDSSSSANAVAGVLPALELTLPTPFASKDLRTSVHMAVKRLRAANAPKRVLLDSGSAPGDRIVVKYVGPGSSLRPPAPRINRSARGAGPGGWPASVPTVLEFTLCKSNQDLPFALSALTNALGLGHVRGGQQKSGNKQSRIMGFAGTKDKRGVTSQLITVSNVRASRLRSMMCNSLAEQADREHTRQIAAAGAVINHAGHAARTDDDGATMSAAPEVTDMRPHKRRGAKIPAGLCVGNFRYIRTPLKLGDLGGNEFTIVVRDLQAILDMTSKLSSNNAENLESAVSEVTAALAQRGFINYFGLQRFGTGSVATHTVGAALLRSDFEGACRLILSPRAGELSQLTEVRRRWAETLDHDRAIDELKALTRRNPDGSRAAVPYGSIRVDLELLSGLRSLTQKQKANHQSKDSSNAGIWLPSFLSGISAGTRSMYCHAYQSYVWNHMCTRRLSDLPDDRAVVGDLVLPADHTGSTAKPKLLTTDDEAAEHSIYDVVLPLPGFEIQFPTHSVGQQAYAAFMADVGLESSGELFGASLLDQPAPGPVSLQDHFLTRQRIRDFALPGAYRHIVARANHVEWRLRATCTPEQPLLPSDVDAFFANLGTETEAVPDPFADGEPQVVHASPESPYPALLLRFELGSSTYATMVFRELFEDADEIDRDEGEGERGGEDDEGAI